MKLPAEQWFDSEIAKGLAKLVRLNLNKTPAEEIILDTADTWINALWTRSNWDAQRDISRIKAAFLLLAGSCTDWPAPAALIGKLPPKPDQQKTAEEKEKKPNAEARKKVLALAQSVRVPKGEEMNTEQREKAIKSLFNTSVDDCRSGIEHHTDARLLCDLLIKCVEAGHRTREKIVRVRIGKLIKRGQ